MNYFFSVTTQRGISKLGKLNIGWMVVWCATHPAHLIIASLNLHEVRYMKVSYEKETYAHDSSMPALYTCDVLAFFVLQWHRVERLSLSGAGLTLHRPRQPDLRETTLPAKDLTSLLMPLPETREMWPGYNRQSYTYRELSEWETATHMQEARLTDRDSLFEWKVIINGRLSYQSHPLNTSNGATCSWQSGLW